MSLIEAEGFSIAELEASPDDGRRYELIGGSIIVSPVPTPRHQRGSRNLLVFLNRSVPADHEVFCAPIDLDLPGGQRVEPDLVVVPSSSIGLMRLSVPALLVVELISPTNPMLDTVLKRAAYAEAGIEHYWLIDTRDGHDRFTALRLRGDDYETTHDSTERIDVTEPLAVSVTLPLLLDPPTTSQ